MFGSNLELMRRIVRVVALVVVLLLVVLLGLPFLMNANQFRPVLEEKLTSALGREVKVGDLRLALLSGGVAADDLSIADDPSFSRTPFLMAKSLKVGVELWPLISSRKVNVTGITIDQPAIALIQSESGDWNFSSLGAKKGSAAPASPAPSGKPLDLSVKLVKINGGRLSLANIPGKSKPRVLDKVNIEMRDFSAGAAFPFSLAANVAGGGEVKLEGQAGPINPADTALTPVKLRLNVTRLNLAESGFVNAASGIAGLVSLDGTGESNGRSLELKGRLKGEQLKLAKNGSPSRRPVEFDFTIEHQLEKRAGVLRRGDIHIGGAPTSLTGDYRQRGESTILNMNLSGPNMPVPELAEMLPALGVVLPSGSSLQGGTAKAKLSIEGPTDRLGAAGSFGVDNTRLANFDLGSKLSTVATLAGIKAGSNTEIQTFSANVRTTPESTSLEGIKLIAPSIGELSGGGTISASHALDFKMRATLHTSGGVIAVVGEGDTSVPFFVQGTASDPVFRPDVRSMASEKVKNLTGGGDVVKKAGGLLDGLLGRKKEK
jgi:AsmA protein